MPRSSTDRIARQQQVHQLESSTAAKPRKALDSPESVFASPHQLSDLRLPPAQVEAASSEVVQFKSLADARSELEQGSAGRRSNRSYNQILGKLEEAVEYERSGDLDACDDLIAVIREIEALIPSAASTHRSLAARRNAALDELKSALEEKTKEVHALRYQLLVENFGNPQGRIVFRGDGRGPESFGLETPEALGNDEEIFSSHNPDDEQSIMLEGGTQNMISTSEQHNLPTRYLGNARTCYDKSSGHRFNFTVYAIYLPEDSAVRVSDYLKHRQERHDANQARGEMSGEDNIGSRELASKVAITKGNILGYRVIGNSPGIKSPGPYVSVNEPESQVPEADAEQFDAFKNTDSLHHTGAM